jgi:putative ABC transport system permease protein
MSNRNFFYFFGKSISQRKGRVAIASLSVMLAVSIVTGLAGISYGIRGKLGSTLRSYGANLIVTPRSGDFLPFEYIDAISGIDGVISASGQVFGRVRVRDVDLELIGLEPEKTIGPAWKLQGHLPQKDSDILAGINLRKGLEIETGTTLTLTGDSSKSPGMGPVQFTVSGFFEKGGAEDSALILPLEQAWGLLGIDRKLSAILVRGRPSDLDEVARRIENALPGALIKTLRQVAVPERSILRKIQLLMSLVTIVVLFAAVVSIMSSMGANVIERREEIGLMKALGASRNGIRAFYLAEATLTGITGGISGFILGYALTQAVSWGAFGSLIPVPVYFVLISVVSGLLLSLAASHIPVRDALKYNPAVILREE